MRGSLATSSIAFVASPGFAKESKGNGADMALSRVGSLLGRKARGARSSALWATSMFALASVAIVAEVLSQADYVGPDFKSFYFACRAASLHLNFYDVEVLQRLATQDAAGGVFPFLYTPVFPHLFASISRLRLPTAQLVWSVASIAALTAALAISAAGIRRRQRALGMSPVAWPLLAVLGLGLALALNLRNVVVMGQINLFVMLLALPSYILPGEARHVSCAMLALAILLKVTPLFLVFVFLAERRFRLVGRVVVWLSIWVAASMLLGAWRSWLAFAHFSPQMSYGRSIVGLFPASNSCNFALAGFYARLTETPQATFGLTCLTLALLSVPVLYRVGTRRGVDNSGAMLSAYVLVIVAAPLAYVHHVMMLFPVLLWASADCILRGGARPTAIVALGIFAGTDFPLLYDRLHLSHAAFVGVSSLNLYALLGLYLLGLWEPRLTPALAASLDPPSDAEGSAWTRREA